MYFLNLTQISVFKYSVAHKLLGHLAFEMILIDEVLNAPLPMYISLVTTVLLVIAITTNLNI